ncbi:siderophore synthetase component [Rudaeicoccus suwonensis]|uniref:Lysine N-acyltransferase MbtK n=2 Tax=Rudaeicoccus suwonensis TaxID=657409 RepID=A0A561E7Z3_9MICO|nr:siderophore synthetase component [Rudaeicoccus suwonensis]
MQTIMTNAIGEFALRPVDPEGDAALLHRWVTDPKSSFWMMQDATVEQVQQEYQRIQEHPHHDAFIGLVDGTPCFLTERYDPAHVELVGLYDAQPGDIGMHLLCGPTDTPRHGFTRAVITAIMTALFDDPTVMRVVVEPDIRNTAVHRLNATIGFREIGPVQTPVKTALLSICTRDDFARSVGTPAANAVAQQTYPGAPADAVAHLQPRAWADANRILVTKALSEFSHERLLSPARVEGEPDRFTVTSDDGSAAYSFTARRMALEHWQIEEPSVTCRRDGQTTHGLDMVQFVLDLRASLGLSAQTLPVYLEEIVSTLSALAFKLSQPAPTAADLVSGEFQQIESAMLGGHPCFIANSGRIGFGAHEYQAFAPESARPVHLVWLAARASRAHFSSCRDTSYDTFIRDELGDQLDDFHAQLRARGLDPADYTLIPVHPWQWWNKLSVTFAAEVAMGHLVVLGESSDDYRAQQSIRTFFNSSQPTKHYVKTALSVINMGFMRGLSAAYMEATPAINDWLADLVADDETFTSTGVGVIRERAAVGYHPVHFEAATDRYSPYRKMLAALWRESPVAGLASGERLSTMAALLHVDREGRSFVGALVAASGLSSQEWLRGYLRAYLVPLLHSFYKYGLAFMPHGENVILVLRDGTVERVIMKDLAEEIVVMSEETTLPETVERVRAEVPHELQLLSIFTDVFDCFLRHLAAIMDDEGVLSESDFWREVAGVSAEYQREHPELADRFAEFDVFADDFALSCLNRLQLRNNQQMVDLADPAGALQLVGTLRNPLAAYRPADLLVGAR